MLLLRRTPIRDEKLAGLLNKVGEKNFRLILALFITLLEPDEIF